MCRRCGAPDRRPGSKERARLTRRLLEIHGNGVICGCVWCDSLIAAKPGRLHVGGRYLPVGKLERDRLEPGGPYSLWNLVPSCGPCNRARGDGWATLPEGCRYGGWTKDRQDGEAS